MKPPAVILATLILAFAVGVCGWLLSRPDSSRDDIARLERELREARAAISKLHQGPSGAPTVTSMPAGAVIPLPGAVFPPPPAPGGVPAGLPPLDGAKPMPMEMGASSVSEMISQQSQVQIQMVYGDLFSAFKLSPEQQGKLQDLLGKRAITRSELDFKLLDPRLTSEAKKQLVAEFEAAKSSADETIRSLLGNEESFQKFQHAEATQPERTQMNMMGGLSAFETTGEPLSPAQLEQLITVMAAARKGVEQANPIEGSVDERIMGQLKNHDAASQKVTQNAAQFLTPVQIQALNKMQQDARTTLEMGLRMTSSMQQNQPR